MKRGRHVASLRIVLLAIGLIGPLALLRSAAAEDWPDYEKLTRQQVIVAVRSAGTQKPVLYAKNLTGVHLSGIDFRGANLGASVFNHADLRGANLSRCDLTISFAEGANLERVDLRESKFIDTEFTGANLRDADFTGSTFRGVKGLEQAVRAAARGLPD